MSRRPAVRAVRVRVAVAAVAVAATGLAAVGAEADDARIRLRNETGHALVPLADRSRAFAPDTAAPAPAGERIAAGASDWLPVDGGPLTYAAPQAGRGFVVSLEAENDEPVLVVEFFRAPVGGADPSGDRRRIPVSPTGPSVVTLDAQWKVSVRPVLPVALTITPDRIPAGANARGTIALSTAAEDATVRIEHDVVEGVEIPESASGEGDELTFLIKTAPSEKDRTVRVRVSAGGVLRESELRIDARGVELVAVTPSPRNATGGGTISGIVHVRGMTETSDPVTVSLRGEPDGVELPDSVVVRYAPRLSRARFEVRTPSVAELTKGVIHAELGDETKWADFNIFPLTPSFAATASAPLHPGDRRTFRLRLKRATAAAAGFRLHASPGGILDLPAEVTIAAGGNEVEIPVSLPAAVDIEGPTPVVIRAESAEYPQIAAQTTVEAAP